MALYCGMKDELVPIDPAGRIVLPKGVRRELVIKPGDLFKVSIHGTVVILTPSKERSGFVRKEKALVFVIGGEELLSVEAVRAALEKGREEMAARISISRASPAMITGI